MDGDKIFQDCAIFCICVDDEHEEELMQKARDCIEARGGTIVNHSKPSHNITLFSCQLAEFGATQQEVDRYSPDAFAVTFLWLYDCIVANKLCPFKGYELKQHFFLGVRIFVYPESDEVLKNSLKVYCATVQESPFPDAETDYIVASSSMTPEEACNYLALCAPGTFVESID